MENIVTVNDINSLNSELYGVTAMCNKNIVLDPYLAHMLSPKSSLRKRIITRVRKYDFDIFLEDYGCNLQRPYVWETVQQTEFLISLLQEKPIESVIVINKSLDLEDKNTVVEVIDGKQRLLTIKKFLDGEIGIHLPDRVLYYKDFDKDAKIFFTSRVNRLTATVYYEDPETKISDADKIRLFNYYNFAGTPQTAEHKNRLKELLA